MTTTEPPEPRPARATRLTRELALALKWDRPAILLAIYSSEYVRADVERDLTGWLRGQGQRVVHLRVTGQEDADVPLRMRSSTGDPGRSLDPAQTVFFVSGLGSGAPTSYRALNLRREYLVQDRIRAVFWLTEREAVELAHQAPDFWVFRGRTVEFLEAPEPAQVVGLARELAYWDFLSRPTRQEVEDKIALRQNLLAELPPGPETEAARAELLYTLGGTYWAGGRHQEAVQTLRDALDLARSLEDTRLQSYIYNGLGSVYRALKQYDQAIAAFQRAIALDPDDAYPHNNLGNVYRALKQYDQAIAAFQRAIALNPDYATPHNGLGNVYSDRQQYDQAIAAFQRAIELDPDYARIHNNLGLVYRDMRQYDQAIAAFQRAIALDPDDARIHNNLGNVYHDRQQYDQAIAAFQRAIALDPDDASPYRSRGIAYSLMGDLDQAKADYSRSLELDPDEGWVYASLASIYRHRGDEEQYAAHLAEARRRLPPDDDYAQACLASIAGDADAATSHLARALEQDPERRDWAREDPDFHWIRDDPRYLALVAGDENTNAQD
jgi:tetratricopeptide (TPR) repeat protein